jgi:hypothetical protein
MAARLEYLKRTGKDSGSSASAETFEEGEGMSDEDQARRANDEDQMRRANEEADVEAHKKETMATDESGNEESDDVEGHLRR